MQREFEQPAQAPEMTETDNNGQTLFPTEKSRKNFSPFQQSALRSIVRDLRLGGLNTQSIFDALPEVSPARITNTINYLITTGEVPHIVRGKNRPKKQTTDFDTDEELFPKGNKRYTHYTKEQKSALNHILQSLIVGNFTITEISKAIPEVPIRRIRESIQKLTRTGQIPKKKHQLINNPSNDLFPNDNKRYMHYTEEQKSALDYIIRSFRAAGQGNLEIAEALPEVPLRRIEIAAQELIKSGQILPFPKGKRKLIKS